mmetsp:Transcript_16164/g.44472  ORF Transcript_16164/g.44472 Transcript_16164/m.44472 type:complete len:294 (+) Transcript_16164:517-1398(+)
MLPLRCEGGAAVLEVLLPALENFVRGPLEASKDHWAKLLRISSAAEFNLSCQSMRSAAIRRCRSASSAERRSHSPSASAMRRFIFSRNSSARRCLAPARGEGWAGPCRGGANGGTADCTAAGLLPICTVGAAAATGPPSFGHSASCSDCALRSTSSAHRRSSSPHPSACRSNSSSSAASPRSASGGRGACGNLGAVPELPGTPLPATAPESTLGLRCSLLGSGSGLLPRLSTAGCSSGAWDPGGPNDAHRLLVPLGLKPVGKGGGTLGAGGGAIGDSPGCPDRACSRCSSGLL